MQPMLTTTRAIFIEFNPAWVIPAVLFSGVISFFTLSACQSNYRSTSSFARHIYTSSNKNLVTPPLKVEATNEYHCAIIIEILVQNFCDDASADG